MSISAVSSSIVSYPPTSQQNTLQENFQALIQALQSGNLLLAQQAYGTLTQNAAAQRPNGSSGGKTTPFQQALASIGTALQAGNLSAAQAAMQSLQQTIKSHHGHHHPHGAQDQSTTSNSSTQLTSISTLSAWPNRVNISA
jgi:hypothetical protein